MTRCLHETDVVVVGAGRERRAGIEANQTPFGERAILGTVGRSATRCLAGGGSSLHARLRLGSRRRNAAVRGIDDERGLLRAGNTGPAVVPEIVVGAADVGGGAALPPLVLVRTGRVLLFKSSGLRVCQRRLVAER